MNAAIGTEKETTMWVLCEKVNRWTIHSYAKKDDEQG